MKSQVAQFITLALAAAATAAYASPILGSRARTGSTANDFTQGGCRDNIFIFARGTGEPGNIGAVVGPPTASGLKSALGDQAVAAQGVDYAASQQGNFSPGGADAAGIKLMTDLVNDAAQQCPNSQLLVSGYSQGASLVHAVVSALDRAVMDRIAAVVTFGDPRSRFEGGKIKNFSPAKTLIICNPGDAVCEGSFSITQAHLDYAKHAPEAVDFIVQKVRAAN